MFDITPVTTRHRTACGPACLKMLLAWYGIEADLDQLIEECGVRVDGCTAADILRVARLHGLEDVHAYQADAASVLRQDRPGILYWLHNHFVIYAGLNDAGAPVICNPARGRYAIDAESFCSLYSGVMLSNGMPEDYAPMATDNVEAGEVFTVEGVAYRALLPIARGEKLRAGINCETVNMTDILNEKKESEE